MPDNLRELLDPSLFWEYRWLLVAGLRFNLLVLVSSGVLSLLLSLLMCVARLSRFATARTVSRVFAELARNTPEYILLVWIHYVPPVLLGLALHMRIAADPLVSATLALGISSSGYVSETLRAGVLSVPRGHSEAALAVGLRPGTAFRRIVLPQALRRMLPELLNQGISLFKGTTLVSLIAVPDIMYQVSMISSQEMQPVPLYTGAALIFCAIVVCASLFVRVFAERWRRTVL